MNDERIETDFEKIKDYLDIDTYYDELSEFKNLLYEVFGDRVESQKYIVRTNKKLEQLQNRIKELEQINEEHRKLNGQLMNNWDCLRKWVEEQQKEPNPTISITFTRTLVKMNELERVK